jgi:hypothetical protein
VAFNPRTGEIIRHPVTSATIEGAWQPAPQVVV